MTSKPDVQMLVELRKNFTPKQLHIIDNTEADLISRTLEIKDRTNIELQNIRDMAVMFYANNAQGQNDTTKEMQIMDAMSAIISVIDQEKFIRGMPV